MIIIIAIIILLIITGDTHALDEEHERETKSNERWSINAATFQSGFVSSPRLSWKIDIFITTLQGEQKYTNEWIVEWWWWGGGRGIISAIKRAPVNIEKRNNLIFFVLHVCTNRIGRGVDWLHARIHTHKKVLEEKKMNEWRAAINCLVSFLSRGVSTSNSLTPCWCCCGVAVDWREKGV